MDNTIREISELINAVGVVITTSIAIISFIAAHLIVLPILKATQEQTAQIEKQTNSLTERLLENTKVIARSEAVKGERARVAEGRPEESS